MRSSIPSSSTTMGFTPFSSFFLSAAASFSQRLFCVALSTLRTCTGGFFLSFLSILQKSVVFIVEQEAVVGPAVEEYDHHVVLRAPRSVGAHAVSVGLIHDRVAVEHKMRSAIEIARARKISDLAGREFEQRDIAIGVAHLGNKFHHNPAAVGTPLETHAVVLAGIGLATGVFRNFAGCQIHYAEMVAVFDKSKLLAVGRNIRMRVLVDRISHVGTGLDVEERHLGNGRRVREIGIFLARHRRLIYILAAERSEV